MTDKGGQVMYEFVSSSTFTMKLKLYFEGSTNGTRSIR